MEQTLTALLYAPPLVPGDDRPGRAVAAVERVLPGTSLDSELGGQEGPLAVEARERLLASGVARGQIPLLGNRDETQLVSIDGVLLPSVASPRGVPILEVHLSLPDQPAFTGRTADLLAAVGAALSAWWGAALPPASAGPIGSQTVHPGRPQPPQLGLPPLRPPAELPDPAVPQRLGWINYWSAETAARLGFPDAARDGDWLARADALAGGAWILRLTDDPLDLGRPDHLEALQAAYRRFQAVGGRG
jgi:hypothetical protein